MQKNIKSIKMNSNTPIILAIDDSQSNLALLKRILEKNGFHLLLAKTGKEGLDIAKKELPDLILLDVAMPGWDGYETCEKLKKNACLAPIPVLFLSVLHDTKDKIRAFAAGGMDYVDKPFQQEELLARVHTHIELYRLREKQEEEITRHKKDLLIYAKELEKKVAVRTAELNKAKEIAEAANLIKSQFLANMSHELRTPMTAIKGFSEILIEDAVDLKMYDLERDLKKIHTAGEHLLELINSVLDLAKIESGKMEIYFETINVEKLLHEVIVTIQPLADAKKNKLKLHIANELGEIHADLLKTRQILFNLLSNATKFTANGIINIDITRKLSHGKEIIQICISDEGIGISLEQQQNLFQPFSQANAATSRKFGGAGLGLSIVKQFTEMMGGEITVNSIFGKGSKFTVSLPVTTPCNDVLKY